MFLLKFLASLPLVVLHFLGSIAGGLVWLLSSTYRRHLRENICLAFPNEEEARRVAWGAIAATGCTIFEIPLLWRLSHRALLSRVRRIEGLDIVERLRRNSKGLIFLTPHLGAFEVAGHFCASVAPTTALFRPPRQAWLAPLMWQGRAKDNLEQAPADISGVRLLLRALKRGNAVFMLPDQAPSAGDGRWLDFFGRPAYTMTLAARLSETNAAVILLFARRLPWGRGFEIILREPLSPMSGTTEERAQQINHEIEALIRQCPEQYLWGYNRYKRPKGAEAPPESTARTEN